MTSKHNNIITLSAAILISQMAGIIGGLFTASSIKIWYDQLNKPPFTPPGWIFGPVWITLYTLMGIAAWLVWKSQNIPDGVKITALVLFAVQLFLNAIWTIIFFGSHAPFAAFIEIILLWTAILLTIIWFFKASLAAGLLMIPYIVWVSFASILNYYIWKLNP